MMFGLSSRSLSPPMQPIWQALLERSRDSAPTRLANFLGSTLLVLGLELMQDGWETTLQFAHRDESGMRSQVATEAFSQGERALPIGSLEADGLQVQGRIKLCRLTTLRDMRQIPARSVACCSPDDKQECFHKV
jgi:hypothetical protein